MTDKPMPPNGKYKQIYYEGKFKPYTSSKVPYDDYRATEVWRKLREKRLAIDDYQCKRCGSGMNPEVHHLRYPDIWGTESVEDDLITLCAPCHAEVHKNDIKKEQEQTVIANDIPF